MNFKKVLIEEAAKQFRKEGATIAVITLYSQATDKVIRDIEVDLSEENRYFAIAGRTPIAEAAMSAHFCGHVVNGEKWFPFHTLYKFKDADRVLAEVAVSAGLNLTDLKWSFINEH